MFEAPEIIKKIDDISAIYECNERQGEQLDKALEALDGNIFLSRMGEEMTGRWESIIGYRGASKGETLEDRRSRVKLRVNEKLPYSYRVILNKLRAACGSNSALEQLEENQRARATIPQEYAAMKSTVTDMLEDMLPLDVRYVLNFDAKEGQVASAEAVSKTRAIVRAKAYNFQCAVFDGTAKLDGSARLDAYRPAGATRAKMRAVAQETERITDVEIRCVRNLAYIDGSSVLDGSRVLNSEDRREEL